MLFLNVLLISISNTCHIRQELLESFKVISLFSYQGCVLSTYCDSFCILPLISIFVNNFFIFLFAPKLSFFRNQLEYLTIPSTICQYFFDIFLSQILVKIQERRRRDLNPRAAINDLHPFQGCPFGQLGYFSRWQNHLDSVIFCCFLQKNLIKTEKVGFEPTVPFGITGFQDQLLKPLGHLSVLSCPQQCIHDFSKIFPVCQ